MTIAQLRSFPPETTRNPLQLESTYSGKKTYVNTLELSGFLDKLCSGNILYLSNHETQTTTLVRVIIKSIFNYYELHHNPVTLKSIQCL
jgi:hypothetical protein